MSKYIPINGPVTADQIGRHISVGQYKDTPDTLDDANYGEIQVDATGNLKSTLATALSKSIDSIASYPGGTSYTYLTASGAAAAGAGILQGIFVSSASSTPTITVYDNTAGSGTTLIGVFTPVAGTMYRFADPRFSTGCYIVISGTLACTIFTGPTTV
ncbi:MAG TPA: hypothetical protein VHY35_06300 [Stellaceae bacterium]|jgi:hypothetical protein|nr:hypothetical protein [Stellaceae bacterium]